MDELAKRRQNAVCRMRTVIDACSKTPPNGLRRYWRKHNTLAGKRLAFKNTCFSNTSRRRKIAA
jgi:hypothetical protein